MVDDGSAVDILYLNAYKRMGLTENDLDPNRFIEDHIVAKEVAKSTIIVGEHPWTLTVIANLLVVDAPSAINRIIGRSLLKALKVATLIYHLTMKSPTDEGIGKVHGNQYDSREYYNKSLRIVEKDNRSPRTSVGKAVASSSKRSDVTEQDHA